MSGIVINIDPTILRLGHFMLNWYGIIVMLAILAAIGIAIYEGKRKGISSETILSMSPWVVLGGIIGARLFHVVDKWDYYMSNPLQAFALWQGGLAIWGALAGGAVGVLIYARTKHLGQGHLADTMVPGFLDGQIIGRFACIIDGDAVGGATTLPWAFTYINPGAMVPPGLLGVPVHPYPVYDQ
ncbi:MAG: prolipoprotein diacylglyceryl transferase, partial [Chloroflexota bacterium]